MVSLRRLVRPLRPEGAVSGARALGKVTGVVILAAVVVIAGAVTYVAIPPSATTCAPANSPICQGNIHDLGVLIPLRTSQEGVPIPVTALVPSAERASSFVFNFGDGTTNTSINPTMIHSYNRPGIYIISVFAMVGKTQHDNFHALGEVTVALSYASDSLGTIPSEIGAVVANSTSTVNPTPVLHTGEQVTVQGAYTLAPTNPLYTLGTPTIVAAGGTVSGLSVTAQGATAAVSFLNPGIFEIEYVGSGVASGHPTVYENYTWTAVVAPAAENYALAPTPASVDPHPGHIIAYESYSGGATTFDPAIDYDLAGYEVVGNVYQTLVLYNGSSAGPAPADYIAEIATCVPGTPQCSSLYGGNSLIQGTDFTFVISSAARFYDPYDLVNGAHPSWGVYPSDVMFSALRTLAFSQLPYPLFTNGWILTQSLLPGGNSTWDGGIHATFNNTPAPMFASMTINGTECPSVALTQEHGCITFHANANNSYGNAWPFFLELISDQQGSSIVPCGWFSMPAQGQGIPNWTASNASDQGPHPCKAPTAAQVNAMSFTGFDGWEQNYYNALTGVYAGNTQWRPVGSGPYYLTGTQVGLSYDLAANPAYQSNPLCTWTGCQPPAGKYVPSVHVVWESDPVQGEQSLASGVADFATFPATDTGYLLELVQGGKANALVVPSLAVETILPTYNFSKARENTYTSNPVTIPADFFSHLGMRQFFVHAYPYAAVQSTINTVDGVQYGFDYGGSIPNFMGNYYPHDINWPGGNPCTDVGNPDCPAYWWAAMHNPSSPYYYSYLASNCIPTNPCQFPIYAAQGDTAESQRMALFIASVASVSGGAIQMSLVDNVPSTTLALEGSAGPGTNALPMETGTWFPDYPDPTDYVYPFYYPDATFTLPAATAEGLGSSFVTATPNPYNSTLPSGAPCPTDYNFYVNISAAGFTAVPESCQGAAYDAMIGLMSAAGSLPPNGLRVLQFDQAEQIANQLALMISEFQNDLVVPYAGWIDPSSVPTNVIYAGFYWWWLVNGNGVM
jgi:peptide/nickel transport system substrate-binding protein